MRTGTHVAPCEPGFIHELGRPEDCPCGPEVKWFRISEEHETMRCVRVIEHQPLTEEFNDD